MKKMLAFSLAEMLVALVVVSCLVSAFAPVITKKRKNSAAALSSLGSDAMPVGTIVAYLGQEPPEGWLLCDGEDFSALKYPKLKEFLGTNKTPNLRGYSLKGATLADIEEANK